MRVVGDEQLGDRVDEVVGLGRSETIEHRRLRAFAERDDGVRERGASVAFAPVQHEDRILDHHSGGNLHERATREKRVVQHREGVFRRVRRGAEELADLVAVARRDPAHAHALGLECGVDLVVDDPPVAHDDHSRVAAGFRGPGPAARRPLFARSPELVLGERPVASEVELTDPAVTPDLFFGRRPRDRREPLRRARPAARTSQSGPPSARAASTVNVSVMRTGSRGT